MLLKHAALVLVDNTSDSFFTAVEAHFDVLLESAALVLLSDTREQLHFLLDASDKFLLEALEELVEVLGVLKLHEDALGVHVVVTTTGAVIGAGFEPSRVEDTLLELATGEEALRLSPK